MSWKRRWRIIVWVATAFALVGLYEASVVATHHLASDWPHHARFHALVGGLYFGVVCALTLLLAWGPLREGGRAARLAFALAVLAIPGVGLLAATVVPGGGPPPFERALAVAGLVIAAGLAVACWRRPTQA